MGISFGRLPTPTFISHYVDMFFVCIGCFVGVRGPRPTREWSLCANFDPFFAYPDRLVFVVFDMGAFLDLDEFPFGVVDVVISGLFEREINAEFGGGLDDALG